MLIAKFKINEIDNITLGISKNDLEDDSDTKEKVNLPLLENYKNNENKEQNKYYS